MLIRVRSNVGVWRMDGLKEGTATVQEVLDLIAKTRPHVVYEKPLSLDPACTSPLVKDGCSSSSSGSPSLQSLGLRHGSMIHCRVDPSTCADVAAATAGGADATMDASTTATPTAGSGGHMKRVIGKDGSIQLVPTTEVRNAGDDRGFRKGMMPLRDMKMAWTLNEFMAMDDQFVFKLKRQEDSIAKQASLDSASVIDFQSYLQRFQFQRKRFAFLYGRYEELAPEKGETAKKKESISSSWGGGNDDQKAKDDKKKRKIIVEAIYEPPQEPDPEAAEGWEQMEDPLEETVDQIAQLCGLQKVGWIFGHPPREDGYVLSAAEVIMAAELQLEAAGGVEETPFVTVKVTQGNDGNVSVEAFQVSQQCMAMVAEEALEIGANPGFCQVNDTFTAIQEGKESKTVDNTFFLTVVPIVQHNSAHFVSQFPKMNRELDDRSPSHDEMKKQLSKSGTAGWSFMDLLSDFNLLIYLSKFLDVNADFPKICQSVVNRDVPLDDGYKIIITSMAGVDGAY